MSEPPKLYANKPNKAQLKQFKEKQTGKDFSSPPSSSSPSVAAPSYTMSSQSTPPPPPPPPPQQPKDSFARRYKFLWPLLLTVNLGVGVYLFTRTKKKKSPIEEEDDIPSTTLAPITEKPLSAPLIVEPVKLREPIPQNQQRELLQWILDEKRKVKPINSEEKKRLDEEKAILKQYIRAKFIPNI